MSMKTLRVALESASADFLRQVRDYNAIPRSPSIRYYETDCGHVYYKTWLGFLIPDDEYHPAMEKRNLWPTGTEKRNAAWEKATDSIFEVCNAEDVDGFPVASILARLQWCYASATQGKEHCTVDDIATLVSDSVYDGYLPDWCDGLLRTEKTTGEGNT